MGRPSGRAWKWVEIAGRPVLPYKARFTHQRKRCTISTGSRVEREAAEVADRRYLAIVTGKEPYARVSGESLSVLYGNFMAHLEALLPKATVAVYGCYVRGWMRFFPDIGAMVSPGQQMAYMTWRMGKVARRSHRKERSLMTTFFKWAVAAGHLSEDSVPKLPDLGASKGTPSGRQRKRAVDLTVAEVRAIIDNLPALSERKPGRKEPRPRFFVRLFFEFLYETGLRPSTVKRLVMPANWRPGQGDLVILSVQDKALYGRTVPLSKRAAEILEEVAMSGSLFGWHDMRAYTKVAAEKAGLPKFKAKDFAVYDFRHARATHLLDAGAPLTAVAYLLGHKQVTTTNVYVRAQKVEAAKWV